MRLQDVGEFGLIHQLTGIIGGREGDASGVVLGVGDDAALFRPAPERLIVATADMLVENVHFRRDWMSAADLGWKALAVNLSDCAAMGALPRFALVCVALDKETAAEYVLDLYRGMQTLAARFEVRIAGGDTVASPAGITLSVAAVGEVEREEARTRAGARPGDVLMVTGTLGDSAAGCAALLAGREWAARVPEQVLQAHRRPWPRVREARAAVCAGGVTALIDVSDGLAGDLRHLCEESGAGAEVEVASLPVSDVCRRAAEVLGQDSLQLALTGGEDYELLLAVAPDAVAAVQHAVARETGTCVTPIGVVTESGFLMRYPDGGCSELPAGGFQHFP
ncbi:MAG: thiamine-phosphate kinase [Armatimonadota bacterium]|nr:thiamine-phosphate kinase [Armatimonadota bacterium]